MAVKIKLQRLGKIRTPHYRVVVADARTRREGRAIEVVGQYHPKENPSLIKIDSPRVQYWLSAGAQPTEPVLAILKITGDWQKFKKLPGAEGTLSLPEPKPSKQDLFNQALAEINKDSQDADTKSDAKPKAKRTATKKKTTSKTTTKAPTAKSASKKTETDVVDSETSDSVPETKTE